MCKYGYADESLKKKMIIQASVYNLLACIQMISLISLYIGHKLMARTLNGFDM